MQASAMELVLFREEGAVDDRLQQVQHGGAVVKRKRTKRPRHLTPPAACSSASSSESTTTEEEDMAHCLILLAQGAAQPVAVVDSRPPPATVPQEAPQGTSSSLPPPGPLPAPAVVSTTKTERYTSRKYTEAATTADGVRAGFYVYECKTCNKCFPTFQALGGHRASHKKPRLAGADDDSAANATSVSIAKLSKPPSAKMASPPLAQMTTASPPPPPPPQVDAAPDVTTVLSLNNGGSAVCNAVNTNRLRVHECSICGAEFASGQALGGHMRRHRPLHAPADRATAAPVVTAITASTTKKDSTPAGINLELDLNLPAPSDEECVSHPPPPPPPSAPPVVLGLGPFDSGKKRLMLTAASAALVDCHY